MVFAFVVFLFVVFIIVRLGYSHIFQLPSFHFFVINWISLMSCYYLSDINNMPYADFSSVNLFYSLLLLVSLLSFIKLPIPIWNNNKFIFSEKLHFYIYFFLVVDLSILVVFLLNVNLKLLLRNNEYLTLADVKKIGLSNGFLIIYHRALAINGMICFFIYGYMSSINKKSNVRFIPLFIGLVCLFWQISNNSRSSCLVILGYTSSLLLFYSSGSLKYIRITLSLIVVFYIYSAVLVGRNKIYQGSSQIFSNIKSSMLIDLFEQGFLLENIFGGAWIFLNGEHLSGYYPDEYKMLSFSPFPSSLDNFDQFLRYQHRINIYVPYNANLEVFLFGYEYTILYFVLLFIVLRQLNLATIKNKIIGYSLCIPAYLFFIAYQQYPLRNYFRFLLFSFLLCWIYLKFNKVIVASKRRKLSRQSVMVKKQSLV